MKHFLLLAFVAILVSSCGKDNCSADTFVGTWAGTKTCTTSTGTSNVSVVVTKNGDKVIFNGDSFVDESMDRDDCTLEGGFSALGSGETYTASVSEDGKSMTVTYEIKALSIVAERCTYTLTK